MSKVIIKAVQTTTFLKLDPSDHDVWGRYAIDVYETEDDEEKAAIALDGFYAFVPMRQPEHFRLEVQDENGRPLKQAPDNRHRLMTGYAGGIHRLPWL